MFCVDLSDQDIDGKAILATCPGPVSKDGWTHSEGTPGPTILGLLYPLGQFIQPWVFTNAVTAARCDMQKQEKDKHFAWPRPVAGGRGYNRHYCQSFPYNKYWSNHPESLSSTPRAAQSLSLNRHHQPREVLIIMTVLVL